MSFTPDGRTAYFDELLDNEDLGEMRGSGVLVREDGAWKVAQYNLSIPIPGVPAPVSDTNFPACAREAAFATMASNFC